MAFRFILLMATGMCWCLLHNHAIGAMDQKTNGLSDVWETAYGSGLVRDEDIDNDGFTNAEEAAAGTNPHDASHYPRSGVFTMTANDQAVVQFPSVPGMRYQLEVSTNLLDWAPYGVPMIGSGQNVTAPLALRSTYKPGGVAGSFWTGLTGYGVDLIKSYATNQSAPAPTSVHACNILEFPQTSPNLEQFGVFLRGWLIPPATGEYIFWIASDDSSELWLSTNANPTDKRLIASVPGWTGFREWSKYTNQQSAPIGATISRAYESTGHAGQFTMYRSGGIEAITIPYTLSGFAIPGDEYQIPGGTVMLAPGQRGATIDITPINDSLVESGETVVVSMVGGTNYMRGVPASSIVTIDDAPDILYVALMRAIDGISAGGSGVGEVRRAGNALSGSINLSFNGLSSDESAAEIFISISGQSGTTVSPTSSSDALNCMPAMDQMGGSSRGKWPGGNMPLPLLINCGNAWRGRSAKFSWSPSSARWTVNTRVSPCITTCCSTVHSATTGICWKKSPSVR